MASTTIKEASLAHSIADVEGKAISDRLLKVILESLDAAKAEDILPIKIRGKSALADYMVVASGRSSRHVNAVCDQLLRALKAVGMGTSRVEGLNSGDWVLIDCGDVIVHVFRPEVREFYALEKIWNEPDLESGTVH